MDVRLPKLGEGAETGTVVSVFVKEGDAIQKGQTILELENEKAVAPIPSPIAGRVAKLRVKEGDKLSVGQVILSVENGAGAGAATPAEARAKAPQPEPAEIAEPAQAPEVEAPPSGLPVAASPAIRKIARELGIDSTRTAGGEAGGRIVMADLRAWIQRLQRAAAAPAAPAAQRAPESIDFSKWGEISKKPMSPLRKTISERLSESWRTIPHVTQFDEADITALNDLRKKLAPAYESKGARLTLTSFALKAVVSALKKHPIFNASLDEAKSEVVFKEYFHIGVAVDTDQGLIVPVIRDVDKKTLLELSRELNDLTEKTRQRKISVEELQGGTFTISNQGSIGGSHFTPIIYAPQVAILGVGQGGPRPVVVDEKVIIRTLLPLCLAYDHRVLDGADAVRFLKEIIAGLESFDEKDVKIN